ncbi:hypothetical protein [Lyngbya aestuarii]|uniref:hypothetical protein n=1 Tax=Lyngbya aestuarii TaxID=118322 RepID=UPI00403E0F1A
MSLPLFCHSGVIKIISTIQRKSLAEIAQVLGLKSPQSLIASLAIASCVSQKCNIVMDNLVDFRISIKTKVEA